MAKEKQTKTEIKEKSKSTPVLTRGRFFEGTVTKKFQKRVVIVFERTVFLPKYQAFYKKKTKLHARFPEGMDVNIGDYVRIQECRPLSKIIHFMVVSKLRSAENGSNSK
jgi:small subunit ribosomal protein S17